MCGIAGLLDLARGHSPTGLLRGVRAMTGALARRGPDGAGFWSDGDAGIAFGHRRLAIVDLTPAGHQPMLSADTRMVVTYNGELYNVPELAAELAQRGVRFRGHSDTEVLVEACAAWGVEATLAKLNGIFALAVWDRMRRRLTLARDPLGVKPLYWGVLDGVLAFGSELKALRAWPHWRPEIERTAVAAFLGHAYVPAPRTIYAGVEKLAPGALVTFPSGTAVPIRARYWRLDEVVAEGLAEPDRTSGDAEATAELEALLADAVGRQMVSDVPLGAFLSGGVDSSAVVAMMQRQATGPVRTFSIGFRDRRLDEAAHARAVAAHLGTNHTELYVEPAHALAVVPRLPEIYDEPFADASQIPTILLSELTRQHVTVALSGDGGDELFAGYRRYAAGARLWRWRERAPAALGLAERALGRVPGALWDRLAGLMPARMRPARVGERVGTLRDMLRAGDPDHFVRRLVTFWPADAGLVRGLSPETEGDWPGAWPGPADAGLVERMQFADSMAYLPDGVLAKVDRASMAVGLEARVPLLDPRLVAFAWRQPMRRKIRGGETKWLLRQVLYRHVPQALVDRPKQGFSVPLGDWLRGPLADWAEALLDERRLAEDGLLDPAIVRRCWTAHRRAGGHEYLLWPILMLQAWLERWGGAAGMPQAAPAMGFDPVARAS